MMKVALVVAFSDLGKDPRVDRQIRWLCGMYEVVAAGFGPPRAEKAQYVPLCYRRKGFVGKAMEAGRLLVGACEEYYWGKTFVRDAMIKLEGQEAELVVANDIDVLPVVLRTQRNAAILLDAHEYAPREYEDRAVWRLMFQRYRSYLCARYMPRTHALTTVSHGIAELYRSDLGTAPTVVTNAPRFEKLLPSAEARGDERIRLIHHGAAAPPRRIELMIRMMAELGNRFELNLMLVNIDSGYLRKLQALADGVDNVRFIEPVPMDSIAGFINRFDVGVYILPPSSVNNRYALPNKFFEFIQGRLAVAVGPSEEMARIVREHDLGVVAENFTPGAMVRALRTLTRERINYHKERAHILASWYCAERNRDTFLKVADRAIGRAATTRFSRRERPNRIRRA